VASHCGAYRQSSRSVDRLTPQVTGHDTNYAIGAVGFSPSGGPAKFSFCPRLAVAVQNYKCPQVAEVAASAAPLKTLAWNCSRPGAAKVLACSCESGNIR
jgi:hypothetical protein